MLEQIWKKCRTSKNTNYPKNQRKTIKLYFSYFKISKTAEKSEENFERVLRRLERGDVGSDELQKASSNRFTLNYQKLTNIYKQRFLSEIKNGSSRSFKFIQKCDCQHFYKKILIFIIRSKRINYGTDLAKIFRNFLKNLISTMKAEFPSASSQSIG